jgi:hypothetical protein
MNSPRNLWPWAIILTFVLFISGTIGLVVMASTQREDLVSENYYEQELKFQNQIDRVRHLNQLSAPATATYDASHRAIRLSIPPPPNLNLDLNRNSPHITGLIQLYRPSEAALDRYLKLQLDAHGCQSIDASTLRAGLWKIRITWAIDNQEYFTDQQLVVTPS